MLRTQPFFAQTTTGYILIIKANMTDIAEVKTAVSNLDNIGGNILGFILNDVTSGRQKYYSYYKKYDYKYKYSYGYGYGYGYK